MMHLAIDLGSSEFKAAICAGDKRLLGCSGYKLSYLKEAVEFELAVEELCEAFDCVIRDAAKSAGIGTDQITAVGITSQAQTFTICDGDGIPQLPFISWLDTRAAKACEKMLGEPKFANFAEHSSIAELLPVMQICILRHLMDGKTSDLTHNCLSPSIDSGSFLSSAKYRLAYNTKIMPLPSYLIFLMTGEHVTDNNISAMSGLYSPSENRYWKTALEYLRISQDMLPKVVDVGTVAGTVFRGNIYGLSEGIPVFSCGNDQTAGAYGADLKDGDILLTLGTALVAYCRRKMMPEPEKELLRGIYPDSAYYAMFAENGGSLISRVIRSVPEFQNIGTFAKFASDSLEKGGKKNLVFTADKNMENISWSDNDAPPADKAEAVLRFLSENAVRMVGRLGSKCENRGNVYVAGGGTRNRAWIEILGEMLKSMRQVETSPIHGTAKMMEEYEKAN